jgi:hypothetical protein
LQYTVVQEDLEAGGVLLNTTADSDLLVPSVSGLLNVAAEQIVDIEATFVVVITGEETNRFTAPGKANADAKRECWDLMKTR